MLLGRCSSIFLQNSLNLEQFLVFLQHQTLYTSNTIITVVNTEIDSDLNIKKTQLPLTITNMSTSDGQCGSF